MNSVKTPYKATLNRTANNPSEDKESVKPTVKSVKPVYRKGIEEWLWIPELLDDINISGYGRGGEIVSVIAGLLQVNHRYGFEFRIWRAPEDEAVKKEPDLT